MTGPGDDLPSKALLTLAADIAAGDVSGMCLVAIRADGGFVPLWFGAHSLGPHGGSILRGAVCWLGAEMDAKARST